MGRQRRCSEDQWIDEPLVSDSSEMGKIRQSFQVVIFGSLGLRGIEKKTYNLFQISN